MSGLVEIRMPLSDQKTSANVCSLTVVYDALLQKFLEITDISRRGTSTGFARSSKPPVPPSNCKIRVFRLHGFRRREQHAGSEGGVGALFDEDERAGQAVGGIPVEDERLGG